MPFKIADTREERGMYLCLSANHQKPFKTLHRDSVTKHSEESDETGQKQYQASTIDNRRDSENVPSNVPRPRRSTGLL